MKPTPKGKLPKWAVPVGIAAVLALVIVLRKRKASATKSATEPGAEGLTNQSFIPVTGENVAGIGAGSYGGTSSGNNEGFIREFLKEQQQEQTTRRGEEKVENREAREREQGAQRESNENQRNFYEKIIANLGTGGGAPGGAPGGVVGAVPAPGPAPPPYVVPPSPAPAPPPAPGGSGCPADFPYRGPHGCWRWSRQKTGQGCSCHGYQNGTLECEHKVGSRCTF